MRIRSDNSATVSALNKSTSRSAEMMPWVREIFWISVEFDFKISSVHIPGKLNVLADRISRLSDLNSAMDARLLLANFSSSMVICNEHMTIDSFCSLQAKWTQGLRCCVKKRLPSSG